MNRSFKTMTEDAKRQAFIYSCADGHTWEIPYATYNQVRYDAKGEYLPNFCPTCHLIEEPCPTVIESSTSS